MWASVTPTRRVHPIGVHRVPGEQCCGDVGGHRVTCPLPDWQAGSGRLAQRESASFTPKRSLVRSQYRPPYHCRSEALQAVLDMLCGRVRPHESHATLSASPRCATTSSRSPRTVGGRSAQRRMRGRASCELPSRCPGRDCQPGGRVTKVMSRPSWGQRLDGRVDRGADRSIGARHDRVPRAIGKGDPAAAMIGAAAERWLSPARGSARHRFEPCSAHEYRGDPVQHGRVVQRISLDGQNVRVVADGESALATLVSTAESGLGRARTQGLRWSQTARDRVADRPADRVVGLARG